MTTLSRVKVAGCVAHMESITNTYEVFIVKPKVTRQIRKCLRSCGDITEIYFKQVGVAEDRDQCRGLVNAVISVRVS